MTARGRRTLSDMRVMPVMPAMLVALLTGALAGCAARSVEVASNAPPDWRAVATLADRARLADWRGTWTAALAEARAEAAGAIADRVPLFDPDAALPDARPPAGDYACAVTKLGARDPGARRYAAYPAFRCTITDDGTVQRLVKQTGSQRMIGALYADSDRRAIFLGTLQLGDERRAIRYGDDAQRDMAGIVERIGARRWRLVLPRPAFESRLDVVELIPID